ncbi:[FeFe] hydrogenase, group A [Halosquirtibacter xylanolyticus]|uniref:NADH-dependent [FeFe] hydrogenase, group A6 n=1 Tax=Halosquirtibacter xylanolyticus TaxID=3374599 RepID=UPI00374A492D|nr:[FeFe] hydrogenase, group A [Prolixibacteraceae bacterium]
MKNIQLIIDNKAVEVAEGTTILEAAQKVGIHIPALCHMKMDDINIENRPGGCRICSVEVKGKRNLSPACATKCLDGMEVKTNTIRVIHARRNILELIISDHPYECLTCAKSGQCELQTMAQDLGIREIHFEGEKSTYREDFSKAIIRDMDKCILCRRCITMCSDFQTVHALSAVERGFEAVVSPAFHMDLNESSCTFCGQCVAVCPTGALSEADYSKDVIQALANPEYTVIAQTAPAVRAALGESFGYPVGTSVTGQMVTALKNLGFDYVFDTDFAADMTIMEESAELLERLTRHLEGDKTVKLPILTSCCPAWVRFIEQNFPDMKEIPSTTRSPQQIFGAIAKSYFAEKIGVPREKLIVVSIMPCVAKKYECERDEFKVDGDPDVNFSITTRELARLIKISNIDFKQLEPSEFDQPLGESTGAGLIFGTTGGVIEAATRTAYELQTGKKLENIDFESLRGMDAIRSATVDFDGLPIKIGIAHGLGHARKLLEEIQEGRCHYHAIEIMSCPGGCIGGGGQPFHHNKTSILLERQKAIYSEDKQMKIRKSHENASVMKVYEEFLGHPLSEKAEHLLHTSYFDRSSQITIDDSEM